MRRHSLISVGIVVLALYGARSPSAVCMEPADLIQAMVSRSEAVASGRITYSFKSESFVGDRALPPINLPEVTTSFSNSSWAERSKGTTAVRINHAGYFLEFVQTPQRDGSVRPGATLSPQRSLESRTEFNAPPLFAGSLWHREQLRFVEQHVKDCRIVGPGEVHSIQTIVMELDVATKDRRAAFHVLLPALETGGVIRLYVAPQLGFVLPRVEFLTPSKQVAQSYEAIDFSEVALGVYFPGRLWTVSHPAGGGSRYRGEFTVRCELINQPIPQEDFEVDLPMGTHIQDAREPGSVIKFDLAAKSTSQTLAQAGSVDNAGLGMGLLGRWQNAVIVGLVIGTVISISLLHSARDRA